MNKINKIFHCWFLYSLLFCFQIHASEVKKDVAVHDEILATFSIDGDSVILDITNKSVHSILVRGFFEGISCGRILKSSTDINALVSNEQLIQFNYFNRGRLLIHLSGKKDVSIVATSFDCSYKIVSNSFLSLIKSGRIDENTVIEVLCEIAEVDQSKPEEYKPVKIYLKYKKRNS